MYKMLVLLCSISGSIDLILPAILEHQEYFWSTGLRVRKAHNLTAICGPTVVKS
jgi:hypothetical protein